MKTLLTALMLTLFSSISYGGSLDGKGLVCGSHVGYWFDNNSIHIYQISGHEIHLTNDNYTEVGTDTVEWGQVKAGDTGKYALRWATKLDRSRLMVGNLQCVVVSSKKEITAKLNMTIESGKKKNKI